MRPEESQMRTETETISGRDNLKQTGQEALGAARERADDLQHRAAKAVGDMGVAAQERTEAAKGRAAEEINRTADGLEAAAKDLEGSPLPQDLLREAAGGLRQLSQAVSGRSIGELTSDLSDFARRNPVGFLGGAALAGFAMARFVRADRPGPRSYGSSSYGSGSTGSSSYGSGSTGSSSYGSGSTGSSSYGSGSTSGESPLATPYGSGQTGSRGEAPGVSGSGTPVASAPVTGASPIDPVTPAEMRGESKDV
jgi:hypothetical protein